MCLDSNQASFFLNFNGETFNTSKYAKSIQVCKIFNKKMWKILVMTKKIKTVCVCLLYGHVCERERETEGVGGGGGHGMGAITFSNFIC